MSDPRGRHYVPEKETPPGSLHHGGSFRKYMENKNRKLRLQFDSDKTAHGGSTAASELFAGISIWVNGLTTPTHQELKLLMAQHGGRFEVYYYRDRVTHIICSNLTDAKVKQFHKSRDPTPIIRPEWIVDSLNAGEVLPVTDYQLWRLRDLPGQQALASFSAQPHTRSVDVSAQPAAPAQARFPAPATASPQKPQSSLPVASPPPLPIRHAEQPSLSAANAPAASPACRADGGGAELADSGQQGADVGLVDGDVLEHRAVGSELQAGMAPARQDRVLTSVMSDRPADSLPAVPALSPAARAANQAAQAVAARARAACDVLRGPPQTTHDNPDFMDTYFRSSRLHFIGTWKARIEALAARMGPAAPSPAPHASTLHAGGGMRRAAAERAIIHLDMDCFFAAVAELTDPALKGQPLAVSHSASAQGTGEVSSANYEARKAGIRAGMFIGEAKRRCPHLVVMPYTFDKFEEISEQVYHILLQHTALVQPVSVDEAYLDVTGLGDAVGIAEAIRAAVEQTTGCTASAGIACNMLLARLATKRAKPNGVFRLTADQVDAHMLGLAVEELPGVGWSLRSRLTELGIASIADVRKRTKAALQRDLGDKTGAALWESSHGIDARPVEAPKARKSIGAEVNWGVRFASDHDAEVFLDGVAGEVCKRLEAAGVQGRTLTLKLKRRKAGAPEPPKFMGHGSCDNLSRSLTLSHFTASHREVAAAARQLLRALRVPCAEVRGIGIAVAKLSSDPSAGAARPSHVMPGKAAAKPPSHFLSGRHTPFESWLQQNANPEAQTDMPRQPLQRKELLQQQLNATKMPKQAVDEADGGLEKASLAAQQSQAEILPEALMPDEDVAEQSSQGWRVVEDGARNSSSDYELMPGSDAEDAMQTDMQAATVATSAELDECAGRDRLEHSKQDAAAIAAASAADAAEAADLPSLSQMDAGTFTALPSLLQQELVHEHMRSLQHSPAATTAMDDGSNLDGQQQQHSKARSAVAASSVAQRTAQVVQLEGSFGRGAVTPIGALPPASQLDVAVLDALPLPLKRELERAYGLDAQRSPPVKMRRGRGRGRAAAGRPAKRVRASPPPAARPVHMGAVPMMIDPKVLAQLPEDMQRELMASLPSHRKGFASREATPRPHVSDIIIENGQSASEAAECQRLIAGLQEPREIWAAIEAAIDDLASKTQPKRWQKRQRPRPSTDSEDLGMQQCEITETDMGTEKLAQLCDLIIEWGQLLAEDNLEGLQFVLRQVQRQAQEKPRFEPAMQSCLQRLQQHALRQHGAVIALEYSR